MFWNRTSLKLVNPACLLALGLYPFSVRAADSRPHGRSIEFSAPKGQSANTNLVKQMMTGEDSLKSSAKDPFKVPETIFPRSPLNGMALPPQQTAPGPPIQSKRIQALMEKHRNWPDLEAEEMIPGMTPEDNWKNPDAKDDWSQTLSPIEKILQRQFNPKDRATDKSQPNPNALGYGNDATGNYGTKNVTDALPGNLNGNVLSPSAASAGGFPSANDYDYSSGQAWGFNNNNSYKPSAPDPAQQARMEEYKKLYGLPSSDNALKSSVPNPWASAAAQYSIGGGLNPFSSSSDSTQIKPASSTPGDIKSSVAPTMLTTTPAKTPAVEEQNRLLFAPPFSMPKRRFQ